MITFSTTEYVLLLVGLSFLSAGSARLDAVLIIAGFTLLIISWSSKARRELLALLIETPAHKSADTNAYERERHYHIAVACHCGRSEE